VSLDVEVEALKQVPLFRGIDPTKLRLLAFMSERMKFRAGERLCEQGERGDSAFIILSGEADIAVDTPTGEQRVAKVRQNDIVGEISILIDVPRTASVVAAGDVVALSVSKESFLKLMSHFPEMALEVTRVLAQRLERTTRQLAELQAARQ
jgi:CRP-like cAMP-binding protein